jgi:hypothetical protein
MSERGFEIGDLVVLTRGEWREHAGVVSWPIGASQPGFVLICSAGRVAGVHADLANVRRADAAPSNYSQLAHCLLKLASYVIERAVLPLTQREPVAGASSRSRPPRPL